MGDRQDHTLGSHIVYATDWENKNSFWHRAWRMAGIHVFAMESNSEEKRKKRGCLWYKEQMLCRFCVTKLENEPATERVV